jgi:hypothetical protein
VEFIISRDAANQLAATLSGSFLLNLQGFVQAKNPMRAASLHAWNEHATWTRVKPRLEQNATYKALTGDSSLKQVQVYWQLKNKLAGHPCKVNTVEHNIGTAKIS